MKKYILSKKNHIVVVSAILIISSYISHFVFHNEQFAIYGLVIASIIAGAPIFIQAYMAIKVKVISIDLLVSVAVGGAFLIQNFEESAIVTFLFLFGAYLEQRTLNKTRSAIKKLTEMAPESALLLAEDGSYEEIDVDEVIVGNLLLVKTGSKVPVDGTVVNGEGNINEASITGESLPVTKSIDSEVFAGTILENGTLQIRADKVGEDTTFGKIIELVEEAQDSKSEAERFIDSFSKYYTPAVLLIAFIVWIITKDVELSITILVLGCPGALVIGVPVSNVAGIGNGARNGVLLKGSEVINNFSRVDTVAFDKTGTLTIGKPKVVEKISYVDDKNLYNYLASVEKESNHPLALAVLEGIEADNLYQVENTQVIKGNGVIASVDNHEIIVGNVALVENEGVVIDEQINNDINRLIKEGNSLVLCAVDKKLVILLGIKDKIRDGIKKDLDNLKKLGIKNLIVLSGDNQGTVDVVAKQIGLSEAYGHMLPEDKANYIKDLQKKGHKVAFIGDGVNDSPSLALADVGVAMGNGTDVAIETSDLVLMNSSMNRLPHALGLSKATARNMIQNIVIAIGVVFILLASLIFSDWMNMSIGMFAHEASILVVILNGMRLINYKLK